MNRLFVLALAAGSLATPALAQVTGATLELGHSFFTEDDSIAKTTLGGSAEFGFNSRFGVQGDLGYSRLNAIDDSSIALAGHGLFYVNQQVTLGGFYGVEDVRGESTDYYGFEVGQKSDRFNVQAYVGRAESSGLTGSMMGVEGNFALQGGFGLGGKVQHLDIEGLDATRLGVTGQYGFANGLAVTAEVGTVTSDDLGLDGVEPYIGIGARFDLGSTRGTTFNRRSILSVAAGQ